MTIHSHPKAYNWISVSGLRVLREFLQNPLLSLYNKKQGLGSSCLFLWWPRRLISFLGNQLLPTLLPPLPPRRISLPIWECWLAQQAMEASRYLEGGIALMMPQDPFTFSFALYAVWEGGALKQDISLPVCSRFPWIIIYYPLLLSQAVHLLWLSG